jgi:hypothetical protein
MVLPATFPNTVAGAEAGLRRFAEAFGKPIIVYIKAEGYLSPDGQAPGRRRPGGRHQVRNRREDPTKDAFLSQLCELVDRATSSAASASVRPSTHLRDFGLAGFTTGSGCVGPRGSAGLLAALKPKDYAPRRGAAGPLHPLEDLRDCHSPNPGAASRPGAPWAEIADTGPSCALSQPRARAPRPGEEGSPGPACSDRAPAHRVQASGRSPRSFAAPLVRAPDPVARSGPASRIAQIGSTSGHDYDGKPCIASSTPGTTSSPCHKHFKERVEEVKRGVWQAAASPWRCR